MDFLQPWQQNTQSMNMPYNAVHSIYEACSLIVYFLLPWLQEIGGGAPRHRAQLGCTSDQIEYACILFVLPICIDSL